MASVRRTLGFSVLAALLCLAALVPAASAASRFRFSVRLGSPCVSGDGPANRTHVVTLRQPNGVERSRFRTVSGDEGRWSGCFTTSSLFSGVLGGDTISASAAGVSRAWRVPNIAPAADRVTDVVSGKAPAGGDVLLEIQHSSGFGEGVRSRAAATANGNGRYAVDLSGIVNLIGNDLVVATYSNGADEVAAAVTVPYMEISRADNGVSGAVNWGSDASLTLRRANGTLKGRAFAGPIVFGFFLSSFFDADGDAAYPAKGDTITGTFASDASIRMPGVYIGGDASTDVVKGLCMPNRPYELLAFGDFGGMRVTGRTDSAGYFTRDLTSRLNLRAHDELRLTCRFASGDFVARVGFAN